METTTRITKGVSGAAAMVCAGVLALSGTATAEAAAMSNEELIANATSAAPTAVGDGATVIEVTESGEMRVLREGSNNFTCMADNPASPGDDPMCLDANGMLWAGAWMGKTEPPAGAIGFGYMLQGGSDASNTDAHASGPADGDEWVDTGPHVMIFNYGSAMGGYPDIGPDPDTATPYVMWGSTPYAHLMIPVAEAMAQ